MKFYLDTDLRKSKVYILPYNIDKKRPYAIEFDSLWEAENFLRKINSEQIKGPRENIKLYHLARVESESLGDVEIYQVL